MKSTQGLIGIGITGLLSGTAVLLAAGGAIATAKVTGVQLKPTSSGVHLVLQTQGGDRPQVFSVNRGNTWTADLVNTHLQLPGGSYQKSNPAAGIARVSVTAIDKNTVRVTVVGQGTIPKGQMNRAANGTLSFNLTSVKGTAARNAPPASAVGTLSRVTQQGNPAPLPALPNTLAQTPVPPPRIVAQAAPPSATSPLPPFQGGAPMVPNPTVTVEGRPYTAPPPVPPFAPVPLPRAVAPPVGDMAIGQIDTNYSSIDLGTAERVPRLVLRDASAREALSLLARSANLNIVFTADQPQQPGQQPSGQQTAADGPKVTLDIVNEPIQNVFNYVLQVTGLQANRRGNTIFVGTKLPNSARSMIMRSVRLNQVKVSSALQFLVTLGAESAVARERLVTSVNSVPITNISQAGQGQIGQQQAVTQSQTTTEEKIEVQRVEYKDSDPILRGLQVSGDERTNTLTLVGDARKVEIAMSQLTQLDVRRRQVAVNVRVVDINLLSFERLGSSFSFGVNDTQVSNNGGIAVINFGQNLPAGTGLSAPLNPGSNFGPATVLGGTTGSTGIPFFKNFLLQLQAAVTNGSAKILTDPTLVVQEGQKAQVELGQEVITNINQQTTATQQSTQITVTVEKKVAGLTLPIEIDRIDDNGFISLSVAPLISRPQSTQNISFTAQGQTVTNPITLLALRRVESGQVRLRDGQTLLLSGIIQDQDRTTVTKVPILGDIPILGALFRRTENQNERSEVIVLLTPRILDDSDRSAFGYSYTPGVETQRALQQMNRR